MTDEIDSEVSQLAELLARLNALELLRRRADYSWQKKAVGRMVMDLQAQADSLTGRIMADITEGEGIAP